LTRRWEPVTRKVWIHIKGVRVMDGEQELVDETGPGDYYKKNGKHYIMMLGSNK
jgi:uncharacterized beta-barrel protein YwiB (DUF1934 family)